MSLRILKYKVLPWGLSSYTFGSKPRWLAVGTQGHEVVVWAETLEGIEYRANLVAHMTGEFVPPTDFYIGTTTIEEEGSRIVVHVYERIL